MAYTIQNFEAQNHTVLVNFDGLNQVVAIPFNDDGDYDLDSLSAVLSDIDTHFTSVSPTNGSAVEALVAAQEPDCEECARRRRNMLLKLSDWTQLPDGGLTQSQITEATTYRQALRDVPTQSGFPANVSWPTLSFGDATERTRIQTMPMGNCNN